MTTHPGDVDMSNALSQADDDSLLVTAAQHEPGHAVMRWLLHWPAGGLTIESDGSGACAGSGRRVWVWDAVSVTLAGPVAEVGYGVVEVDWARSSGGDLDQVRGILAQCPWLVAPDQDIEAALRRLATAVGDALYPHCELVEGIADRLTSRRARSARAVAALCREHGRRIATLDKGESTP